MSPTPDFTRSVAISLNKRAKMQDSEGMVRAISRGLAVLQAINRGGSITMMEIARSTNIPYPTANRIVQTLLREGMIERESTRKHYRATALVQSLASGFHDDSQLVVVARPHIEALCTQLHWPISIVSRVGAQMMVRDSTHMMTSLTLNNYYPGFTLPIMECSSGKAYLAFCSDAERELIFEGFSVSDGAVERMAKLLMSSDTLFQEIRRNGYATQARNAYTANPGKTSSIAVPLFKDGKISGALVLVFFSVAMSMKTAIEQFAEPLKAAGEAISADLDGVTA
jgi:IclR family transcriptional regulator, mhp operon transcriptional activator